MKKEPERTPDSCKRLNYYSLTNTLCAEFDDLCGVAAVHETRACEDNFVAWEKSVLHVVHGSLYTQVALQVLLLVNKEVHGAALGSLEHERGQVEGAEQGRASQASVFQDLNGRFAWLRTN